MGNKRLMGKHFFEYLEHSRTLVYKDSHWVPSIDALDSVGNDLMKLGLIALKSICTKKLGNRANILVFLD